MHELSLARSIVGVVLDRIERGLIVGRVQAVVLRVGRLTAVMPDNLQAAFDALTQSGPLSGARLQCDWVPVRVRCARCSADFEVPDLEMCCPQCRGSQVTITTGRELIIDAVEVE